MRAAVVRNLKGSLHWPVVVPAALLLVCGLLLLSGLVIRVGTSWLADLHLPQLAGIAVGVAVAVVVTLVPYKSLVSRAYIFYGLNILLLVLVLVAGATRNHARRWLNIFGFDFQPSELMKLTLVLTLARFIRFRSSYKTFKGLGAPFVLTLVPMALILMQPDLGTALLCIPVLFTMLFLAGARTRHLGTIAILGTLGIFPVYKWGLHDYQRSRIDGFLAQILPVRQHEKKFAFLDMDRNENYQLTKSKLAIGAGGWFGVGDDLGDGQAIYSVPERHNDFIFAALGHNGGFFACLFVLALFVWLLFAILAVALRHRDPAGRLICIGVFALFGFQAFINMSMTVGLVPVTGMTLPFLSAGRSSVVVSILAVALVCNVSSRPSYEFGRGDFD